MKTIIAETRFKILYFFKKCALELEMYVLLAIILSLGVTQVDAKENVINIKDSQVKLCPDWIISNHIPNGKVVSLVSVFMTDAKGELKSDKSMLLYGFCDVSSHAGLSAVQLIQDTAKEKGIKKFADWEVSYKIEKKRTDYALVIDAFKYSEAHKAYLWVRRGRMVKDKDYKPTEDDFKEIAPYLKRISFVKTNGN